MAEKAMAEGFGKTHQDGVVGHALLWLSSWVCGGTCLPAVQEDTVGVPLRMAKDSWG